MIVRDHSLSMQGLRYQAAKDYNTLISGIKRDAIAYGFDTIVSVVECGHGYNATVETIVENSSINALSPIPEGGYTTLGRETPLFDSVGRAIEICKRTPDFNDKEVAFLVSAITDGEENASHIWDRKLANEINHLQATDRWSFIFRVPKGYYKKSLLGRLSIPDGNIAEWELTEKGFDRSTKETASSFSNYYSALRSGVKSTGRFFTNLTDVKPSDVKRILEDISPDVHIYRVESKHQTLANHKGEIEIRSFVEHMTGNAFLRGSAFYELMKTEKIVQGDKLIAIQDRSTGKIYSGSQARDMLGLSDHNSSVSPGNHGNYNVFIQSKSVNRYLPVNSLVLHWPKFHAL